MQKILSELQLFHHFYSWAVKEPRCVANDGAVALGQVWFG